MLLGVRAQLAHTATDSRRTWATALRMGVTAKVGKAWMCSWIMRQRPLRFHVYILKTNSSKFTRGVLVKKHIRSGTPEGVSGMVSGLYVKLQHVADMGQKSDRQKVAMWPNGWLYKIILPARSLILSSSSYLPEAPY
jgi:hypothetical protein